MGGGVATGGGVGGGPVQVAPQGIPPLQRSCLAQPVPNQLWPPALHRHLFTVSSSPHPSAFARPPQSRQSTDKHHVLRLTRGCQQ